MKSFIYRVFFWVVLIISTGSAWAQEIIEINEKTPTDVLLMGKTLEILEDTTNNLTIADVSSPAYKTKFVPHKDKKHFAYVVHPKNTYWVRFSVKGSSALDKHYVLENSDLHVDDFELYKADLQNPGQFISEKAGFALPFSVREYPHKNFVFDISPSENTQVYYARIKSHNHNPFIFKIRSTSRFAHYALNEYYLLGMFYGIIVIMALYNLLMYFSFREKVYIQYVAYVVCCGLISLGEDGTGFQYLWPSFPAINNLISLIAPLLLMISFVVYSKSFLELKTFLPKINKVLDVIIFICIGLFILDISVFNIGLNVELYLIPFLLIYAASLMCLKKGLRQARYYIVGYSFMVVSIIFMVLRMSGLIHWDHILFVYSFNIGLVFEIVILSFALGDRIKVIRAQREEAQQRAIVQLKENELLKDQANRELEVKVKERTRDLDEKNRELEDAYAEINRINELLDADNKVLKTNVKELTTARVLMKDVNFEEFSKIFPDKEACLKYLENLKWAKSYECKKCGNTKWCDGKEENSKRCTKCRYDESPTAYTIFHKLKFPINKAFYMLFLVYANKEKITSLELSQILSLRQSTCWNFNKKITEALKTKKKVHDNDLDGWSQLVLDPENDE